MRKLIYSCVMCSVMLAGCAKQSTNEHVGDRQLSDRVIAIDSIVVNADTTSLRGNFELNNDELLFVDNLYCKIFAYSIETGELVNTYLGHGGGPNEVASFMFGYNINGDNNMLIIDSSSLMYRSNSTENKLENHQQLDFGWDKSEKGNYENPANYILMEMSDFGMTFSKLNDNTVLMPLTVSKRLIGDVNADRYNSGHILGEVDMTTGKVTKAVGSFPDIYKEKPTPFFEFFDYAFDAHNNRLYVNHCVDSLIYCYEYPDKLLYTFGYEPQGVNREYTTGYNASPEDFEKDIAKVGCNTGLFYDAESQLIFRTSLCNFNSGDVVMQVYDSDKNLIAEQTMPHYFKLLGRVGNRYVGVRFLPVEEDDSHASFIFYTFSL